MVSGSWVRRRRSRWLHCHFGRILCTTTTTPSCCRSLSSAPCVFFWSLPSFCWPRGDQALQCWLHFSFGLIRFAWPLVCWTGIFRAPHFRRFATSFSL